MYNVNPYVPVAGAIGQVLQRDIQSHLDRQNTFTDLGTTKNANHEYAASLGGLNNAWGTNRWLGFGRATNYGSGLGILTPRQDATGLAVDRVENYRSGLFRRKRQRTYYKTVYNELPQYDVQADMRAEGDYNYNPFFLGGTTPSQYQRAPMAPVNSNPPGGMLGLSGFGSIGGFGGFGGSAKDRFSY